MYKKGGENKKKEENKKKKISKKMTLAIKVVKSKKSGYYTFENKMISNEEIETFFKKKNES
ncbi:DUF4295 family protein [Blattabacterium cuenoti]|uniref:DUF4295 domain-containing protein n=1 Tax=Blattabacterium cuenoti STAT TaxID=1457030 RepID=A0A224AIS5_9FLAO|nr:DUF4295 family protein [Blattabacterium cuenoti]BBA17051.1 hypothetical protein STAT_110 [Blattabacterium cuenoti STAT]